MEAISSKSNTSEQDSPTTCLGDLGQSESTAKSAIDSTGTEISVGTVTETCVGDAPAETEGGDGAENSSTEKPTSLVPQTKVSQNMEGGDIGKMKLLPDSDISDDPDNDAVISHSDMAQAGEAEITCHIPQSTTDKTALSQSATNLDQNDDNQISDESSDRSAEAADTEKVQYEENKVKQDDVESNLKAETVESSFNEASKSISNEPLEKEISQEKISAPSERKSEEIPEAAVKESTLVKPSEAPENEPNDILDTDVNQDILVKSSEGDSKDLSETMSSLSCSALSSPSEGSVTLDSPSLSNVEEGPASGGERDLSPDTTININNGDNNNCIKPEDNAQMVIIPTQSGMTVEKDSAGEAVSEESLSVEVVNDPGVVSPPDVKPHRDTQEEQGSMESNNQDIPEMKSNPDTRPSQFIESGQAEDTSVSNTARPDIESQSVSNGKQGQLSPNKEEQSKQSHSEESVDSKEGASLNSENNDIVQGDTKGTDHETVSDVPGKSSLGLVQAGVTSPDSSFTSSGPNGIIPDKAIDPYSVALDDALGSSSFNTSFVSTDLSTDPDHTDAESVGTEGDSPRNPEASVLPSTKEETAKLNQTMTDQTKAPAIEQIPEASGSVSSRTEGQEPSQTVEQKCDFEKSEKVPLEGAKCPQDEKVSKTEESCKVSTESAQPCDTIKMGESEGSSQVSEPVDAKICTHEKSENDQSPQSTVIPEKAEEALASGQVGDNQGVGSVKDGKAETEIMSDECASAEDVTQVTKGISGTEGGEVDSLKDQKAEDMGKTPESTCTDTVTNDVNTEPKSSVDHMTDGCQTDIPKSSSTDISQPTAQSKTNQAEDLEVKNDSHGADVHNVLEAVKYGERKHHSLHEATEKMLALGCEISEVVSLSTPELRVTEAPPDEEDEPDGSRPIPRDNSSQKGDSMMAPPSSSVVMRKKAAVRLPPQPIVKDVQLQQKIDHEIKMRDGTAKLLAASKHPSQLLEAAKNLLTSNARMIAYMSELQRRKTDEVLNRHRKADSVKVPCKAKIAVSDIRIPLMWRDSDHFKNKGDHRQFAVFCVLKIGTQIYDTTLLKDVDSSMTDLTFEDVIVFENMDPDFECQLEVYCHRLCDDHSIASTPRRIRKKFNEISTSVGRSVGRRLSGLKEDPEFMANMIVGPRFEMIASAMLKLADVSDSISIFDLPTNSSASTEGGSTDLPLFGNFCCRLAAQPRCMMFEVAAGNVQWKVGSEGSWQKQWCMLGRQSLHTWSSERAQKEGKDPVTDITITSDARVKKVEGQTETGYVVQLTAWSNGRRNTYHLAVETEEDRDVWASSLQQHVIDISAWKQACDKLMEIEQTTPPNRRSGFGHRPRSSLYDETPWNDDDSPMTRVLNRLELKEDFLKPV